MLTELELGAWRGLLRAHATLVRRLDAELEEAHGISLSAYEVLLLLHEAPERDTVSLAAIVMKHQAVTDLPRHLRLIGDDPNTGQPDAQLAEWLVAARGSPLLTRTRDARSRVTAERRRRRCTMSALPMLFER